MFKDLFKEKIKNFEAENDITRFNVLLNQKYLIRNKFII